MVNRQFSLWGWLCAILLALSGIGGIWYIGEALNQERQQAFIDTQGEQVRQYIERTRKSGHTSVVIIGNSLLRNALPEVYEQDPDTWLRIVYFDPLYFSALFPTLQQYPPDILVIQDDLFLPLRFGDGQSPLRRLQRHLRETQPLLKRYLEDKEIRQGLLRNQMMETQEAFVPCIRTDNPRALIAMQRKSNTFYRQKAMGMAFIHAVDTISGDIPDLVVLRIPKSPDIEMQFGTVVQDWNASVARALAPHTNIHSAVLSEPQATQCYCDFAHIERSCREPLIHSMISLIHTIPEHP
ncbi:MAG: hypothetical protein EP312_06235 [Gammaproteobacteria bacterium]|nr:MAG: hypothetical protein EP312_06235 [Gammaproteobacteria bacterium]